MKLQRHISNSAWVLRGKRMTEDSIEELISDVAEPFFGASGHKFSSAGREDSDVLMLGNGRPFYMELTNPHNLIATQDDVNRLASLINNDKIRVRDLQIVQKDDTRVLKDSVSTKSKSYVCIVKLVPGVPISKLQEFSGIKDLPLAQQNPTRVPRRADLLRDKMIESMDLEPVSEASQGEIDTVRMILKTSAGTYVKEFVHGDNGRTNPNLTVLLGVESASVVSLDVTQVHLNWPPFLTHDYQEQ